MLVIVILEVWCIGSASCTLAGLLCDIQRILLLLLLLLILCIHLIAFLGIWHKFLYNQPAFLELGYERVESRLLNSLGSVAQLVVWAENCHQVAFNRIEGIFPRCQTHVLVLAEFDCDGVLPVGGAVHFEELVHQVGDIVVRIVLVYLGHHDGAGNTGKVPEHRGVDAPSLGPKFDDPKKIPIDGIVGNLLLDIGIAEVSVETLLGQRGQFVKLLLVRYHFLNVVL